MLDRLETNDDAAVRFMAKNRLWGAEVAVLEQHLMRTRVLDSSSHSAPPGSEHGVSRFEGVVRKSSKGKATFGCPVTRAGGLFVFAYQLWIQTLPCRESCF